MHTQLPENLQYLSSVITAIRQQRREPTSSGSRIDLKQALDTVVSGKGTHVQKHGMDSVEYQPKDLTGSHKLKQGPNAERFGIESYERPRVRNWAQNVNFIPDIVFFPKTQAELARIVKEANASDKKIAIIGKGHSWNALMEGSDYLISTTDMNKVWVHPGTNLVTVEAGATIAQVDAVLAQHGLAVPDNIVGTTDITYGGLMATGSHGAGLHCVPMSDSMVATELVKADGTVERITAETHGDVTMDSLRLCLGLFGVMQEITFKAAPTFNVEVTNHSIPMNQLFSRLPQLLEEYESVEVLWFPFTDNVVAKTWNRTNEAAPPLRISNRVFQTIKEGFMVLLYNTFVGPLMRRFPATAPLLMRSLSGIVFPMKSYVTDINSAIHYVNYATHFPINETEIAIPFKGPHDTGNIQTAWTAVQEAIQQYQSHGEYPLNVILHMRFLSGSSAYMSPAYGNEWTCWMDFGNDYKTAGWDGFTRHVWRQWSQIPGVKLHWAKQMDIYRDLDLRAMYGADNVDQFLAQRELFDPQGRFLNPYLSGLFRIS